MNSTKNTPHAAESWADRNGRTFLVCRAHASSDAIQATFPSFGPVEHSADLVGPAGENSALCEVCTERSHWASAR